MQKKLHIKKGDVVNVISGGSKGEQGTVLAIDRSANRAIVEGVNMITKHNKPNSRNPQGGIEKKEGSIHVSNLQVVVNGKGTKVGRKEVDGKNVRYAKSTGEVIK